MTILNLQKHPLHVWPVYGLCGFLPLSMAGISIFKLLVVLTGFVFLCIALIHRKRIDVLYTKPTIMGLAMLIALATSLIYSSVPLAEGLSVVTKYAKLLLIPIVALLINNRKQAITALGIYVSAQSFIVISSWLLFLNIPLIWVPDSGKAVGVMYSSYLDQALLTAGFAALVWHLRHDFPTKNGPTIAMLLSALAGLNLLFVLTGRSGQICLIAAAAITAWWSLPKKMRLFALILPFAGFATAMLISPQLNQRYTMVLLEVAAYQSQSEGYKDSSSGQRMNYWRKSLEAASERPVLGYGVGTWQQQFQRLESGQLSEVSTHVRNPHQEYLFWAVQLGILGVLLLVTWLASFWWESRQFEVSVMRATVSFLMVFAVACALNSALYDGLVGDYFCTLLALLLALGRYTSSSMIKTPQ
jgi:O-antigen ligase